MHTPQPATPLFSHQLNISSSPLKNPNKNSKHTMASSCPLAQWCKGKHLQKVEYTLQCWWYNLWLLTKWSKSLFMTPQGLLPDYFLMLYVFSINFKTAQDIQSHSKHPWIFVALYSKQMLDIVRKMDEEELEDNGLRDQDQTKQRRGTRTQVDKENYAPGKFILFKSQSLVSMLGVRRCSMIASRL